MKITAEELKRLLAEGPTTFKFKKMDGTTRKMTATTNPEWFPEGWSLEQMDNHCTTVYDLNEESWRRFSNYTDISL